MHKGLVGWAVLAAGAALAASPASALPVDRSIAAEAGGSQATEIAWVCNRRGRRCRWVAPGVWVGPPVWGAPGVWVGPRRWGYGYRGGYRWGYRGGYRGWRGGWRGGRRW
jgi:hypothetical protein